MVAFRYEAQTPDGNSSSGVLEGESARHVRQQLRNQGLTPLHVSAVEEKGSGSTGLLGRELSNAEVVLLTRQLASLLQARLPLARALSALVEQAEKPLIRDRLAAIRADVVAGTPLSQAFARFPKAFSDMYIATVAAGESTGDLGRVMNRLADALEARQALAQKVSAAFIYPAVVTVVALLVVIGLLTYVVPQVVSVFESSKQELPTLTVIMIWLSDTLRNWGWLMALMLVATVWAARRLLLQDGPRQRFDETVLRLPVLGKYIRAVNTARLASTLSILVGSGVPIIKALNAASRTLGNRALQTAMADVQVRVREGVSLSKSLENSGLFPPVLVHLVASGEATGELAQMLERAAQSQTAEVERKTLWLTSLMEPALILVMGLIVLLIVLAVMLPIIEVNQLIR
jgi:general secretion pathway protein F